MKNNNYTMAYFSDGQENRTVSHNFDDIQKNRRDVRNMGQNSKICYAYVFLAEQ